MNRRFFSDVGDRLLEAPVVPSFSRVGYEVRKRLDDWRDLDDYDVSGRVAVVTGGTSGLGRAAAAQLARCGATVVITGRDLARTEEVAAELRTDTGSGDVAAIAADMGDRQQVRLLATAILEGYDRLDVLLHNAGALTADRRVSPDGIEATVASQVVGPFLLTAVLLPRLGRSAPARVITVSSGGMYAAPLTVSKLEMTTDEYKGADQYARAKRAQVTLNEMWADRFGDRGIIFSAMHPGWADTPGVDESLPTFARLMGPALRTPDQGADTMVWLAADDAALSPNGGFWLDRRLRSIHKLPTTRSRDTPARRDALWDWVVERAGFEPV